MIHYSNSLKAHTHTHTHTHTHMHSLVFNLTGLSVILIIFSSAEAAVNIFILKYIKHILQLE